MTGQRRTRSLLAIGGWLIAAAAATAIGLAATGAAGAGITGSSTTPLSEEQVDSALAHSSPAPSAQPSAAPSGAADDVARALDSPGGTIIARCQDGRASLLSWSPAQGYDTENVHAGPAIAATVTFEAQHEEIEVRVDCVDGVPTAHTTTRADNDQDQD